MTPVRRLGLSAFQRRFGLPPRGSGGRRRRRDVAGAFTRTLDRGRAHRLRHHPHRLPPHRLGREPRRSAAEVADYLADWLPAWMDDWLDLQRWDLLGELLVVDACLPRPTLDERAWEGFAAAQQPDGAMPAVRAMPEGDTRRGLRRRLPPDAGRRLRLRPGHVPRPDAAGAHAVMTVGARPARPAPWPGVPPDVTGMTWSGAPGDDEAVRGGSTRPSPPWTRPTSSSPSPGTAAAPCAPAAPHRPRPFPANSCATRWARPPRRSPDCCWPI